MRRYGILAFGLSIAASALMAHHSIAAAFDESKPVTVRGIVTKFEWTNPHVYIWVDSTTGGRVDATRNPLTARPVSCDNPAVMFPYLCDNNQNFAPV